MRVLGGNKGFVGLRTECNPTYSTIVLCLKIFLILEVFLA
jgi:hypothetical protein